MSYTVREPVGVVAAITPWNSPTMIAAWKIAPALAAGCAVILKPPEDAPLTSLLLASLHRGGRVPARRVQRTARPGAGDRAACSIDHPGVDKISFTGSPETGHESWPSPRRTGFRRTTLELGGKSPQIVFADADLDAAADGVAVGIFANQGEVCAAGSRILVARAVYDEIVERLVDPRGRGRVGDPFDDGTTMGALISARAARSRPALHRGRTRRGRADSSRAAAGRSAAATSSSRPCSPTRRTR